MEYTDKVLIHEKDFTIEQRRMVVEFFIWSCPNCGKKQRTMEFSANLLKPELFCGDCCKYTRYAWEEKRSSLLPLTQEL